MKLRRRRRPLSTLAIVCCISVPIAHAQQLTDVTIEGHVYEPQLQSPTDARIATLSIPSGFHLQRSAEGLDNPRTLSVDGGGTIYVTQRNPDNVVMLRDTDGDGIADVQRMVLRLKQVHGTTIRSHEIYLADVKHVYAAAIEADGSICERRAIVHSLPDGGQHPNRTLGFSPQGELLSLSARPAMNAASQIPRMR